jgi:clan AA aspartic protease
MNHLDLPLFDPLTPTLELVVLGGGRERKYSKVEIECLIDTGFDDCLAIPYTLAKELDLEVVGEASVILADGSQVASDVVFAHIIIQNDHNLACSVPVQLIDEESEPLVGIRLLSSICDKFSFDFLNKKIIIENVRKVKIS